MNRRKAFFLHLCFLITFLSWGQIKLPKLISDGAVLQRDTELKIWGWASPKESVALEFNNSIYKTKADDMGNWQLILPAQGAGGPYTMDFVATNKISLKNILFGDVWLCSGQSNMELTMSRLRDKYPGVIEKSKNFKIRQFLVPDTYSFNEPVADLDGGSWKEADPENIFEFSGVAYFFAKNLFDRYNVPIGLINAALGGSPVEAWMSEDALKYFPESFKELQKFKDSSFIAEIEKSDRIRQETWYKELDEKDLGLEKNNEWFLEHMQDNGWDKMKVPDFWANHGIGNVNGVVWFRKHIAVPSKMADKDAKLWLGRIVDQDHVYLNGEFVGTTGYQYPPRKYAVKGNLLKEGNNTIVIRIINEKGKGGFISDKPYFLAVGQDTLDLRGEWKYKLGTMMPPLEGPTFVKLKPGGLYNKMIAPVLNYKIKGAIWYQGESNTGAPEKYFKTFPALIDNWRAKWQQGDFPFIYVQLTNFMEETHQPTESNWAKLRQAQLEALAVPNSGMVVTIDIGEWNDIHPLNKEDVGKRLAQEAFKLAYGEDKVSLCPVPKKYEFLKNKVKIEFDFASTGLKSRDGEVLKYFEVSNDGNTFYKAKAKIEDNNVLVWNENIANPIVVRYAWANNPAEANLISKDGLPVSPFEIKK
jgi:sialate O-acetylesterase